MTSVAKDIVITKCAQCNITKTAATVIHTFSASLTTLFFLATTNKPYHGKASAENGDCCWSFYRPN